MSSYVNSHYHFKSIHKSLLKWWRNHKVDYGPYIERMMEKFNVAFYGDETPVTIEEHVWVIVRHMIEAQVACVAFQYNDPNRENKEFSEYVQEQTKALILTTELQDRCPSYEYPGLHKLMRGYLYQCEIENFNMLEDDERSDYNAEHYGNVIEFVEWLTNTMAHEYISSQHGYDQAPWGVGPDDLLQESEPTMIMGPE